MKILFLPKYHKEGASSRYRMYNYIPYFEAKGHQVRISPLLYDRYVRTLYQQKTRSYAKIFLAYAHRIFFLLLNRKYFDLLIIEKELLPGIPYFIEAWLLNNCKYTLDFDDAVSKMYQVSRFKRWILGEKINRLAAKAKRVTVGNRWYWHEISATNLVYIPTVIDLNQYKLPLSGKMENPIPIIVWIGTPFTVGYLKKLEQVFQEVASKYRFTLRVIGANLEMAGVELECLTWSEEREFDMLHQADIGIMPLNATPWEKGKCGFKLIQYMASALPTVASPAPANEEIVVEGETGLIAKTDTEWYEALVKLICDPQLRVRMGKAGRKRVEMAYSYQVWGEKFVKVMAGNAMIDWDGRLGGQKE